jgi:hypothetical protein
MGSVKIADNSVFANSQPTESTNDIHIGKNIFNLPANDPLEQKEKMNQNDRYVLRKQHEFFSFKYSII